MSKMKLNNASVLLEVSFAESRYALIISKNIGGNQMIINIIEKMVTINNGTVM